MSVNDDRLGDEYAISMVSKLNDPEFKKQVLLLLAQGASVQDGGATDYELEAVSGIHITDDLDAEVQTYKYLMNKDEVFVIACNLMEQGAFNDLLLVLMADQLAPMLTRVVQATVALTIVALRDK